MKRIQIAALGVATVAVIALFAWGAIAGAEEVMGIIAAEGDAVISAEDQDATRGSVTIGKAVSPGDAWVVVHQSDDGMPGKRLGLARVEAGTSRDVRVELDPDVEVTPELLVALHADRGMSGEFEFDMQNMEHSPDRPYFVDGMEVAVAFAAGGNGSSGGMAE